MDTPIEAGAPPGYDPRVYAALIARHREHLARAEHEAAWLQIESAHVVGQTRFVPHLETHALMLTLALRTRDLGEAAGQVLRLLLVPLGHALGRLPLGNAGRSNISAFRPMPVRDDIARAIAAARAAS